MRETISARVSQRLKELAAKRGFKKALAARLDFGPSWVSPYVSGERAVTLDILEAMAELSGKPAAELVAPPETVWQLDADEARLVRTLRRWPKPVTHALLDFLGFFADEAPTETRTRNLHELWRRLTDRDQEFLYGLAVMLREKAVAPDLRAGLLRRFEAEAAHRKGRGRHGDER